MSLNDADFPEMWLKRSMLDCCENPLQRGLVLYLAQASQQLPGGYELPFTMCDVTPYGTKDKEKNRQVWQYVVEHHPDAVVKMIEERLSVIEDSSPVELSFLQRTFGRRAAWFGKSYWDPIIRRGKKKDQWDLQVLSRAIQDPTISGVGRIMMDEYNMFGVSPGVNYLVAELERLHVDVPEKCGLMPTADTPSVMNIAVDRTIRSKLV